MQIWVDADGCPAEIKELLYRAAERRKIMVTFVANQPLRTPASPFISSVRVGEGMNVSVAGLPLVPIALAVVAIALLW